MLLRLSWVVSGVGVSLEVGSRQLSMVGGVAACERWLRFSTLGWSGLDESADAVDADGFGGVLCTLWVCSALCAPRIAEGDFLERPRKVGGVLGGANTGWPSMGLGAGTVTTGGNSWIGCVLPCPSPAWTGVFSERTENRAAGREAVEIGRVFRCHRRCRLWRR